MDSFANTSGSPCHPDGLGFTAQVVLLSGRRLRGLDRSWISSLVVTVAGGVAAVACITGTLWHAGLISGSLTQNVHVVRIRLKPPAGD